MRAGYYCAQSIVIPVSLRFYFCFSVSMEALSGSSFLSSMFSESTSYYLHRQVDTAPQLSIKYSVNRPGYRQSDVFLYDISPSRLSASSHTRTRNRAAPVFSKKSDGDGETEDNISVGPDNGFGLVADEYDTLAEANSYQNQSSVRVFDDKSHADMHLAIGYGTGSGGGTRAGLFRTPISGGVQSATSAHGLPRPALAVRNLMEQARFAHLCTVMSRMHHRRVGYPFGSLVDFAPDPMGHPIFSFSPLAIHTRNLLADPRCTLVVQIPGWSGLSNARVTIFGDVYPLPEHQQEWAHKQYIAKHQQGPSQQWGNFYYFRMQNISDIYFIGGFGTVAWVDVQEYEEIKPDKIAVEGGENYLKELNAIFSKPLKELLSTEIEVDDAALISIDSKGTDVRVRQGAQFNIQRVSFEEGLPVENLEQAKTALWKLIHKGRVHNMQK